MSSDGSKERRDASGALIVEVNCIPSDNMKRHQVVLIH
jgi:hypothetical protein